MSFDRKTGKPIACAVVKLLSNALSYEILSEDQVTGTIAQEAKPSQKGKPVSITVIRVSKSFVLYKLSLLPLINYV